MNKFDIEIPTLRIESPEPGELFKTLSFVKNKNRKKSSNFCPHFCSFTDNFRFSWNVHKILQNELEVVETFPTRI